jgi:HD superfamily phosphodiesterase
MNLTGTIESVERRFKQILEEFFVSVYDEKSLPSHGIHHHRRVWNNARELLTLSQNKDHTTPHFISKLIIACYLHDIGMSVETGILHGVHSKRLCIGFLTANNLNSSDFSDLLDTIEYHDRKDYNGKGVANDLLTILSVADDLDAFGFIGIYRYSEIYLIRKIKPEELGKKVIDNASNRFDHFIKTFGQENELIMKHIEKYNILFSFFTGYNNQVPVYQFKKTIPAGYCGVIELFIKMTEEKTDISEILKEQKRYRNDKVISWYLNGLKSEIS